MCSEITASPERFAKPEYKLLSLSRKRTLEENELSDGWPENPVFEMEYEFSVSELCRKLFAGICSTHIPQPTEDFDEIRNAYLTFLPLLREKSLAAETSVTDESSKYLFGQVIKNCDAAIGFLKMGRETDGLWKFLTASVEGVTMCDNDKNIVQEQEFCFNALLIGEGYYYDDEYFGYKLRFPKDYGLFLRVFMTKYQLENSVIWDNYRVHNEYSYINGPFNLDKVVSDEEKKMLSDLTGRKCFDGILDNDEIFRFLTKRPEIDVHGIEKKIAATPLNKRKNSLSVWVDLLLKDMDFFKVSRETITGLADTALQSSVQRSESSAKKARCNELKDIIIRCFEENRSANDNDFIEYELLHTETDFENIPEFNSDILGDIIDCHLNDDKKILDILREAIKQEQTRGKYTTATVDNREKARQMAIARGFLDENGCVIRGKLTKFANLMAEFEYVSLNVKPENFKNCPKDLAKHINFYDGICTNKKPEEIKKAFVEPTNDKELTRICKSLVR